MTGDSSAQPVHPEGFDFEQPDESWLARVRRALVSGDDGSAAESDRSEASASPIAGARLGAYELVRPIGAGGMGAVWLARRADGLFERQVAIKLIKRGMDTDAVVRRFHHERHVLASLQHPHIARLYDGGSTPEGRPFLVMEYVEGRPILEFCDTHGLDTEQRLGLFRTVCLAVHHAHRHLVLHRDIKPSNILVCADGTPKLLDFGIAKLLDEEGAEGTSITATDVRALTPRYASPEQVRGERLTTAADVYSLGVVLYELLTGRPPYQLEQGSYGEIERAVLAQDPTRPSAAAGRRDDLSPASARRLQRRLRGDLDTVIMAALEKSAVRRYPSAEQLAEDIRRHLEGLPLLARPAGVVRKAIRIVRRNRTTVVISLIAAGAALAISAAVLTYAFLAPQWAEERLRRAQLALLNPGQANMVWSATFFEGLRMRPRDRPPQVDAVALAAALAEYDRSLGFDARDSRVRDERDVVRLALSLAESPGAALTIPAALSRIAPLTCRYASHWALSARLPDVSDEELDAADQGDLRCLGLFALLTSEIGDALRAWSRLRALEADPLIESLLGVLYLSVGQPERAYPRLLSAYRRYPECGFVCTFLADAAIDCGDSILAGALLDKAERLDKLDDVLGLERVRMRYYLATGQDARAAELVESQPLMRRNPVAVVQYARHRFDKGAEREALELLSPWCIAPVGWAPAFSPFQVNRDYVQLTQRWWSGLDQAGRGQVMLEAMQTPAADLRSLFRILREYDKCVRRLGSISSGRQAESHASPAPVLHELTADAHRDILDWHRRLEIDNAYRWRRFSGYPPELRQLQTQAWLAPESHPSTPEIEQMFESWRRERGLNSDPPYVKLLPSPEAGDDRWGSVRLAGDLALIRGTRAAYSFRKSSEGWDRLSSLAAPPGMMVGPIELDENRALVVCRPDDASSGHPARIRTYDFDSASLNWRLRSDQAIGKLATAGFASAHGVAVLAPSGQLEQSQPRAVDVLRWDPNSAAWSLEQTIDDWSTQPGKLSFHRPAVADDVIVIGTYCPGDPPCDFSLRVYRYDPRTRRWSWEALLGPPVGGSQLWTGSFAVMHDTLVASVGDGGEYDVYVYRRDAEARQWRLEAQLAELLPSPSTWLGCHSLDLDRDRVTAAAGLREDLHDWHADVHVFEYDRASRAWSYAGSARPLDRGFGDAFGEHDLSADTLIIGAAGHDAAGIDAGAAYVFDLPVALRREP